MPAKGVKHTEKAKQLLREARARQRPLLVGKYGITQEKYDTAQQLGLVWCRDCKQFLPADVFHGEAWRTTGSGKRCIDCNKARVQAWRDRLSPSAKRKQAEYCKEWRNNHVGYEFLRSFRRIGATPEWYEAKFKEQGGGCFICKKSQEEKKRRMSIDHCHKNNVLRGLLCTRCNSFISGIEDGLLEAAIEYLKRYNSWTHSFLNA